VDVSLFWGWSDVFCRTVAEAEIHVNTRACVRNVCVRGRGGGTGRVQHILKIMAGEDIDGELPLVFFLI